MPSMRAVGTSAAPDLPARAHVVDQGAESFQAQLRGIAVCLGSGVYPLGGVADCRMGEAHTPVEPRPAAQAPDDRNGNGAYDGRTGHGTRVPEVQKRGAGIFQSRCSFHQFLGRTLLAM